METIESLLNEQQVAEILGLACATLRKWRCTGEGPKFRKIGRAIRYRVEDIQAFIDSRGFENTSQVIMRKGA